MSYSKYYTAGLSVADLLNLLPDGPSTVRLVSVDAEGLSVDLVRALPLAGMHGLDCIVVEHDRRDKELAGALSAFGFESALRTKYNAVFLRGEALARTRRA